MAKVRSSAAPAQNLARGKRGRVGRPRNALAEAAILRTAMELFVECGMEGATMEQIARARVARTTIYRRWSTREALLIQAIADARMLPDQMKVGVESLHADDLLNLILRTGTELITRRQFRQLAARRHWSIRSGP